MPIFQRIIKFHDGTTTTGYGNEINVSSYEEGVRIEIATVGTVTVNFEGEADLNNYKSIPVIKESIPYSIVTSTNDTNYFYNFPVAGLNKIRVNITDTSGDPVFVYGRAIGE